MLRFFIVEPAAGEAERISAIIRNSFVRPGAFPVEVKASGGYAMPGPEPGKAKHDAYEIYILGFADRKEEVVRYAKAVRETSPRAGILFVLNSADEINCCVRPSIKPSALLFRPVDAGKLTEVIREIVAGWREEKRCESFIVKSGPVFHRIPFRNILFFEARDKKIALKTDTQEILFYSNFDAVLQKLPESFVRCHKGFIVNGGRISSVDFREMTAMMDDTCTIPISRLFKDNVKEFITRQEVDSE